MEEDDWSFALSTTTSSRGYHSKSQSDFYYEYEEVDGDDELAADYPCPFCSEDFDLVALCFHIDEHHPFESKSGVCPVCVTRVGMNMVEHITIQHGDIFKSQYKLKLHRDDSYQTPFTQKELQDEHMGSLLAWSSELSTSKAIPDPLLSFIHKGPMSDVSASVQLGPSTEINSEEKHLDSTLPERDFHPSSTSDIDQEEKTRRSDFVRGLLLSTIIDDSL